MQIKSILALGLFGTAIASPIIPRDSPAISDASAAIAAAITDLDNTVLSVTQESIQSVSQSILDKATAVSTALNTGADNIKNSPLVSDLGTAVSALLTAAPLALQGITLVEDIVQKKVILKGAGLTQQVVAALNSNSQATANFVNALFANMPSTISGLVSSVGLNDTSSLVNSIFGVGVQQFQSDAPPPDLTASGGSSAQAGLGSLAGAFGLTGTTGTTGSTSSSSTSNPFAGLLGGSSGGLGALGGLSGLSGLGGGLFGGLGGSTSTSTSTSNPLAGLFGGSLPSFPNPLGGLFGSSSSSSSNPLAGLFGGLLPTATPSAK